MHRENKFRSIDKCERSKMNILHEKSVSFGKIFSQAAISPVVILTYASADSYCGWNVSRWRCTLEDYLRLDRTWNTRILGTYSHGSVLLPCWKDERGRLHGSMLPHKCKLPLGKKEKERKIIMLYSLQDLRSFEIHKKKTFDLHLFSYETEDIVIVCLTDDLLTWFTIQRAYIEKWCVKEKEERRIKRFLKPGYKVTLKKV